MRRPSLFRCVLFRCACLLFAFALLPSRAAFASEPPPSLIPLPAQLQLQPGSFTVDAHTPLVLASRDAATRQTAQYLVDLLARTRGLKLSIAGQAGGAPAIVLRRDPQAAVAQVGGYSLNVTPRGIEVTARVKLKIVGELVRQLRGRRAIDARVVVEVDRIEFSGTVRGEPYQFIRVEDGVIDDEAEVALVEPGNLQPGLRIEYRRWPSLRIR